VQERIVHTCLCGTAKPAHDLSRAQDEPVWKEDDSTIVCDGDAAHTVAMAAEDEQRLCVGYGWLWRILACDLHGSFCDHTGRRRSCILSARSPTINALHRFRSVSSSTLFYIICRLFVDFGRLLIFGGFRCGDGFGYGGGMEHARWRVADTTWRVRYGRQGGQIRGSLPSRLARLPPDVVWPHFFPVHFGRIRNQDSPLPAAWFLTGHSHFLP
jgi:hypothetical protein